MSAAVAAVVLRRRRKGPSKSTGAARKQKAASNRVQYSALVEADRLRVMMKQYDSSKTGKLSKAELAALLKDQAGGVEPSTEELDFVLHTAVRPLSVPLLVLVSLSVGGRIDTQRACFGVAGQDASDGRINDHVNLHELDAALQCWLAIRQNKGEVEKYFQKYDWDKSDKLDRAQMQALLTDLNEGHPLDEEELDWIMEADGLVSDKTGGINRTELMHALALWYSHVEETEHASCHGKRCIVM